MSQLPAYMSSVWNVYAQMHLEDIQVLKDENIYTNAKATVVNAQSNSIMCDEKLLAYLAKECDADITNLSVSDARNLIAIAYIEMKSAGTLSILENYIQSLGANITLVEWFNNPSMSPYTFDIAISSVTTPLSALKLRKLDEIILKYKNVRSHLNAININMQTQTPIYYLGATSCGEVCAIYPLGATAVNL